MDLRPLLLILAVASARGASGDTILLRNGNRIQGEIIGEDSRGITVRFFGGTLHLKARDVVSVQRESRLQYLLEQGEAFLREGDCDLALEAFRKACEADPQSEPAQKGLFSAREKRAEALAARGLYTWSLGAYRDLLKEAPGYSRASAAIEKIEGILKEGAAEEAAAAMALRRGVAEEAAESLRSLYERFPERRGAIGPRLARALLACAANRLLAGRLAEADRIYLEALSLDPDLLPEVGPGFVFARANRLVQLVDSGKYEEILAGAEEGLRIVPGNVGLAYLAAIAQDGLGRKAEAAESYRLLAGLPRDSSRSIESLRKAAAEKTRGLEVGAPAHPDPAREAVLSGKFREIRTEHFIVRHRNEAIGSEAAEAAEAAYKLLRRELSLKRDWRERCTITLFPTKEEFMKMPGAKVWTGGYYERRRFDQEIFTYQTHPLLASATIPHEVAHAMLSFVLDGLRGIPIWLNEGFATHWEPPFAHRHRGRILLQAAQGGPWIPVSKVVFAQDYPPDEETAAVFYAECHFLGEILLEEKGLDALVRFARALAEEPDSLDALLARSYRIKGVRALENRLSAKLSD